LTDHWRDNILRIYYDGMKHPGGGVPGGGFFACGWGKYWQISSLAVCVKPGLRFQLIPDS